MLICSFQLKNVAKIWIFQILVISLLFCLQLSTGKKHISQFLKMPWLNLFIFNGKYLVLHLIWQKTKWYSFNNSKVQHFLLENCALRIDDLSILTGFYYLPRTKITNKSCFFCARHYYLIKKYWSFTWTFEKFENAIFLIYAAFFFTHEIDKKKFFSQLYHSHKKFMTSHKFLL